MSMISEQVKKLRKLSKYSLLDEWCFAVVVSALNEAADTIESLSAKLQAANMENSDLISRSALLQEINGEENANADHLMREWYADMVDRQPVANMERTAEDCGGWIPCKERLPELEQDVLLSFRSLDVRVGYRANTEGFFYVYGEEYVTFENTLAWQPLPEPYHEP